MTQIRVEVVPASPVSGNLRRAVEVPAENLDARAGEVLDATLDLAAKMKERLDQDPEALKGSADKWGLREVDLQFGVTLQAETGVIVAKVGGSATFQVTLVWKKGDGS
jgi:hypothetical protein